MRSIRAADRRTPAQRLPLCDDSYRNRSPKSRQTALGTFRWHLDTWEVFVIRAELGRTAMRTIHTCAASGSILIEMPNDRLPVHLTRLGEHRLKLKGPISSLFTYAQ